uniref:Uncharacterized protein n=1 Tax=Anopheles quadriannulatus TaxID=34691 RepID=A0A182XTZ9_ANOQN
MPTTPQQQCGGFGWIFMIYIFCLFVCLSIFPLFALVIICLFFFCSFPVFFFLIWATLAL